MVTSIKDINDCEPDPCKDGICADAVNSYTCLCDPETSGTNCTEGTNNLNDLLGLHSTLAKLTLKT